MSVLLFTPVAGEKLRPSTYTVYLGPHAKLGTATKHRGEWAFKSCRGSILGWLDMSTIVDFLRERFGKANLVRPLL
jgi:hypothetical protein